MVFHNPYKSPPLPKPMLSSLEFRRQLFHVGIGLALVGLVYLEILTPFLLFLIIINGFLLSFLSKRIDLPLVSFFLDLVERPEQRRKFPGKGVLFMFIGSLLALQLFERQIALAAIMVLALGDSVSHLFGATFGKIKNIFNGNGKKLLEGTLAGTVLGFLGALIFVPIPEAFMGSVAAMLAEVVKIDLNDTTLDDNLIVPLVAGTAMLLVGEFV